MTIYASKPAQNKAYHLFIEGGDDISMCGQGHREEHSPRADVDRIDCVECKRILGFARAYTIEHAKTALRVLREQHCKGEVS